MEKEINTNRTENIDYWKITKEACKIGGKETLKSLGRAAISEMADNFFEEDNESENMDRNRSQQQMSASFVCFIVKFVAFLFLTAKQKKQKGQKKTKKKQKKLKRHSIHIKCKCKHRNR